MPRISAFPDVGLSCPVRILIVVVFPAPLGPRKPRISLLFKTAFMSFKTKSLLNFFERCRIADVFCDGLA